MIEEDFLINELAKRADVTVRTIRYYQDQGLLSAPVTIGRYARYNRSHLQQLELIKKLKELHLPLEEIRRIMNSTDEHEIRRYLDANSSFFQAQRSSPKTDTLQEEPGRAALEYLEKITSSHKAFQVQKMDLSSSPNARIRPAQTAPQPAGQSETWERIKLAPGVELLVIAKTDPKTDALVQELVRFARQLFVNQ